MKVIKASIKGVGLGLLMHNPAGMGLGNGGKKVIPTPEVEAAAACYWLDDEKTSLAFPAWNLFRSLVKSAAAYKDGKTSGSRIVAGSVTIEPAMLTFGTKQYAIDTRRAVVVKQGILRSRPLLKDWTLDFDMLVSEEDVSAKFFPVLRAITEDAGRRVGLGDFRVEKNGPFGKFVVTAWEVQ